MNAENPTLILYTLYYSPADYPKQFVLRRWFVYPGRVVPEPIPTAISADKAALLPLLEGKHPLGRQPQDDACIVGTWV